jgi:hypothetical protein
MPDAILIALVAAPAVVLFLLRINAALVFLSLCLGDVLVRFVGSDAVSVVAGAGTSAHTSSSTIRLILLLAPAVLTMLFMIKTVRSSMRLVNILPAVGTGFLLALLAVPQLSPSLSHQITGSNLWGQFQSMQAAIVAAGTLICLLFLWMQRPKNHDDKHGKHSKL